MSSNGSDNKLPLKCPACGQVWSITSPQPEISNNLYSSCVTIAHEKLIHCANMKCPQVFMLMIQGAQLFFNAQAVDNDVIEKVEGSSIIKPTLNLVN